jgi:dTDP-glucose pyrophosphorylase
MIDINKEAEEYGWRIKTNTFSDPVKANDLANSAIQDFIAGHNSKATQAKVIQAQIDLLYTILKNCYLKSTQIEILQYLNEFQDQLEQLEK